MNNCLLIILLSLMCNFLQAQTQYIDDLDKEFRYKVEGLDLDDRGLEFFKNDIEKELNKSKSFKNVGKYVERVSFMVKISDSIALDYIGIYGESAVLNRNVKVAELTRILNKYKAHWKPAEYLGEIFKSNYSSFVNFNIQYNDKGDISITGLTFKESKKRYKLDSSCFKIIEPKSLYNDPFFYSTEILATYNGGTKMLKSNLNALLKTEKIENSIIDFFTLDFVITKAKELAFFNNYNPNNQVEALLVEKMKLLSCNWLPALSSGRPLNLVLSYKFYYSYSLGKNQQRENIKILDIITQDVPLKTKIAQDF